MIMCCVGTKESTQEFLASAKGRKGFYAWKVLDRYGKSIIQDYQYYPGVNAMPKTRRRKYDSENPHGLHVYLNQSPANTIARYNNGRVIKVFCLFADVIISDRLRRGASQCVLTKITIDKSQWEKASLPNIKSP